MTTIADLGRAGEQGQEAVPGLQGLVVEGGLDLSPGLTRDSSPHRIAPCTKANCEVCGVDTETRVIMNLGGYSVTQCLCCGFTYLSGVRDVGAEHQRYRRDQFTHGYMQSFDMDQIAGEQLESLRLILRRVGTSLDAAVAGGPVLDIGCARGHFLNALRDSGASGRLIGVDISAEMTDWGRRQFHLDLRCAAIEEAELEPASFGLITAFDVLEHVPHPRIAVARILALLRPGCWAVLEVPSETTTFRAMALLAYRLSGRRLLGPIRSLYHTAHLSYFTAASLSRLLGALGACPAAVLTKEAHVTRFGLRRYRRPSRCVIRFIGWVDKLRGTEAKLVCAFSRRSWRVPPRRRSVAPA